MAEAEAEMTSLRQALVEAEGKGAAAAVLALREQVAEAEAEMASLRQALAKAEREGAGAAVQALRDQVSLQAAEMASLRQALAEAEGKGAAAAVQALREQVSRQAAEMASLQRYLRSSREEARALKDELAAAKEAADELRWYDERRDNCLEGRPMQQTVIRRTMEGVEWAYVAKVCEEELRWRLCVDCSRACHVNVDDVRDVTYYLGSLHVMFRVEHNAEVEGGELKDRVAEYPFPATWSLFRRIVRGKSVPMHVGWAARSRAEEKLLYDEALARLYTQLEEADARQAFTSQRSEQVSELLHAAASSLAEEVASSRRECTDSLERLEEFAALLKEARESERELRDRLFATEEDMYELRRRHDDDRDGLVSAEAEALRSLDVCLARLAAQEEAMRVQVEETVSLKEKMQAIMSALSEKSAELMSAQSKIEALCREKDETAAAYADTQEKLEKCVEMLDASRTNELLLSQTLQEAEHRCTHLREAIEMDAAAHRVELLSAVAERNRFKEGIEVLREFLPQLLAVVQGGRQKDSRDGGARVSESTSTSALNAALSLDGDVGALELREVLLHHLASIEQLRRDKEGLADELDEAEKARDDYLTALEDALRLLMEERGLRMRAHESQLRFSEQMMRDLSMMQNAEEDEIIDDEAELEAKSNYELPSLRSSSHVV
ncbi:hypothetical protein GH5_03521 [Leishmania sp. Ghana 2012 LV757]|uniref:hypothetical protein n=1 Tax=Leishmania sp. Ghana 2012 LV757 TaxID=2803181 RepID=UPI001B40C376|nr:hypothetical protein GH5_03521 [Leishmania sp. Ghana 2012 LV757]